MTPGRVWKALGATALFAGVSVYMVALAQWGDCTVERTICEADRAHDGRVMMAVCIGVYLIGATFLLRRWRAR